MFHYTYLIQNKLNDMRYIGVRSSKVHPTLDTNYWGSSKYLPSNVKEDHVKIILKIHETRKDAIEHEILLHTLNDVAINPTYYNKAKQTSTGFDTSGVPISEAVKHNLSIKLKGRTFTEEHREKISKSLLNRPKSDEHRKNCSRAQKKRAKSAGYRNPRQGVSLTEETKEKISISKKAAGNSCSTKNNRFKPWFISYDNVTHLYYINTKEEISIQHGYNKTAYQELSTRSKGHIPVKKGKFKGLVVGNIKDAVLHMNKPTQAKQKRAWFITYPTYSEPFYYETRKDYAERTGISTQAIFDAIHLSKGIKVMKRGPFKGLILGQIS